MAETETLELHDRLTPFRFTPENARIMAQRSHEARREREACEAARAANPALRAFDQFPGKTLMRTRRQIQAAQDTLDTELAKPEPDSKRCKELMDTIRGLGSYERELANRPLPGTLRPSDKPQRAVIDLSPMIVPAHEDSPSVPGVMAPPTPPSGSQP